MNVLVTGVAGCVESRLVRLGTGHTERDRDTAQTAAAAGGAGG